MVKFDCTCSISFTLLVSPNTLLCPCPASAQLGPGQIRLSDPLLELTPGCVLQQTATIVRPQGGKRVQEGSSCCCLVVNPRIALSLVGRLLYTAWVGATFCASLARPAVPDCVKLKLLMSRCLRTSLVIYCFCCANRCQSTWFILCSRVKYDDCNVTEFRKERQFLVYTSKRVRKLWNGRYPGSRPRRGGCVKLPRLRRVMGPILCHIYF